MNEHIHFKCSEEEKRSYMKMASDDDRPLSSLIRKVMNAEKDRRARDKEVMKSSDFYEETL